MKDHFSKQSTIYAQYRPTYPQALYDFILSLVATKESAWDCGRATGKPQRNYASRLPKFSQQISAKNKLTKLVILIISFIRFNRQSKPIPNNNFDLVTVAQALHWFRFDEFYKEVKRLTKTGGVFAGWINSLLRMTD